MPQQPNLTIRLAPDDIAGALRLQSHADCKTLGEALHASLQLFALMPEELLVQVQAEAHTNTRTLNQEITVLLKEALVLRQSKAEWVHEIGGE